MHELSLAEALHKTVETWREENGGKILSVTVEIGRLGGVDPDSLKYAFSMVAPYPVKTVLLPLRFLCGGCGKEVESERLPEGCPFCGAADQLRRLNGRELAIREIEVEDV